MTLNITAANGKTTKKRKLTRSAAIIEEMENRILPSSRVDRHFKKEKWTAAGRILQDFAMLCATE